MADLHMEVLTLPVGLNATRHLDQMLSAQLETFQPGTRL